MDTFCATIPKDPDILVAIFLFTAVAGAIYYHWWLAFYKPNPNNTRGRGEKAWDFVRKVISGNWNKETPLDKSIYWTITLGLHGFLVTVWTLLPAMFVVRLTHNSIC